jgi:hypothetical protein
MDTRIPLALVAYRYGMPSRFTGAIDKLTCDLRPEGWR